jgi:transcription initiation factor TFIIB
LRKWQARSKIASSLGRNLAKALPELDRQCSYLKICRALREKCAKLYREAAEKRVVQGQSIEAVVGASIYQVSKEERKPKTLEEIGAVAGLPAKSINKAYKKMMKCLKLPFIKTEASEYVTRYASTIEASGESEAKAEAMLKKLAAKGSLGGKVPHAMAAAALYVNLQDPGMRIKLVEAAKATGISEAAIKDRAEKLIMVKY